MDSAYLSMIIVFAYQRSKAIWYIDNKGVQGKNRKVEEQTGHAGSESRMRAKRLASTMYVDHDCLRAFCFWTLVPAFQQHL